MGQLVDKENKPLGTLDLLIVDSCEESLQVLEQFCQRIPCLRRIIVSTDGSDALRKLKNQSFALIMADVNAEKKGGLEIAKEVRALYPRLFDGLILTASGFEKEVLEESVALGVKHFLVKPVSEDVLLKKFMGIKKCAEAMRRLGSGAA